LRFLNKSCELVLGFPQDARRASALTQKPHGISPFRVAPLCCCCTPTLVLSAVICRAKFLCAEIDAICRLATLAGHWRTLQTLQPKTYESCIAHTPLDYSRVGFFCLSRPRCARSIADALHLGFQDELPRITDPWHLGFPSRPEPTIFVMNVF
jgi:hypothetical protein